MVDVGCGYGGLLVKLSPLYPESLILGLEIRVKVRNFYQSYLIFFHETLELSATLYTFALSFTVSLVVVVTCFFFSSSLLCYC